MPSAPCMRAAAELAPSEPVGPPEGPLKVWTTVTTCELALRSNELAITRALKRAALAGARGVFIPVLRVGANVAVQRRIAPRDTTCGVLFVLLMSNLHTARKSRKR